MKARKRELAQKGIIKRETPTTDFPGIEEMLLPMPKEWIRCRLNDTASVVRGGSPRPAGDPKFYGGEIPFLKVADVTRTSGMFVEGYTSTITNAGLNKTREIASRTVLLTNSGATLGIPAICAFRTTFNDGIAAFIELHNEVFDEFLYFYLKSKTKWLQAIASRGQGQPNLNTEIIRSMWFPLPPLTEQHEIVTNIKHLMQICDLLAHQLSRVQHIAKSLTKAAIASITGIRMEEETRLKTPKTELVSKLRIGTIPTTKEQAPLASILVHHDNEMDARDLWQRYGGEIDAFYQQLKIEVEKGWIVEPDVAEMREAEAG
jgi:type I restriction enzyme S subunit